jgi:mRNA interferase RelE/StbE
MANYKISINNSAAKEIESIDSRKNRQAVIDKIFSLANNPRAAGCVKLSAQEKYRVRQGDYRILYHIFDEQIEIVVVKVGHRSKVYKQR